MYFKIAATLCIYFSFTGIGMSQYTFTDTNVVDCTAVKNQQQTGTCWSFATTSFLEAELIRQGNLTTDLSEMYVVRNIYEDKAMNYMLRQGKANFSQGSLGHDVFRAVAKYGVVPEQYYSGKTQGDLIYNHTEMENGLKGFLDGVRAESRLSTKWDEAVDAILDIYMGAKPTKFEVEGKTYTPTSYAADLKVNADDYVSLTSFTHHPFYQSFILEIPDNYSNGAFYNVPMDEMMDVVNNALKNGYSIAWDGDVSEKGFSAKDGVAVLPKDESKIDFKTRMEEVSPSQELRQQLFEQYITTDDHLMHMVGMAKDGSGQTFYKIKNSWGEISDFKGYLYMSETYVKMKTMIILVHKDAIPKKIYDKLKGCK